uniref:Uncharacterized protein n=1 Tax=Ciona savignyi TaxID=51511 RepID=H2YNH7_CIOSA
MPETKPFVSKSFASLRGLHEPGFRRHDLHNGADWFNTWRHAAVYKRRKYIKMLKMMIVVALSLTCVFNLKLLVDAKLKYELHKSMYSFGALARFLLCF